MYNLEDVKSLADLIIPKLEAVQNGGSGSTIHRSNTLIAYIKAYLKRAKEEDGTDHIQYMVTCREYIRTAEMWLIDMVKEK